MKKKNLLYLLAVIISGQLFFACNTARHYEFSNRSQSYHTERNFAKAETQPAQAVTNPETVEMETPEDLSASANAEVAPLTVQPLVNMQVKKAPEIKATEAASRQKIQLDKTRKKELKSVLKQLKKQAVQGNQEAIQPSVDIVELIFAILLPPVGVLLHEDGITTRFWISLVLTLLFFFPGMIYAILVVTDTI